MISEVQPSNLRPKKTKTVNYLVAFVKLLHICPHAPDKPQGDGPLSLNVESNDSILHAGRIEMRRVQHSGSTVIREDEEEVLHRGRNRSRHDFRN